MEKEMIQNYAVENSVNVGGKRFLFCISTDENEPHPYMKCRERRETFLAHYENAIAGNDYLEVMKLYVKDISDAIAELENERIALGVENADCLKPEELIPLRTKKFLPDAARASGLYRLFVGCCPTRSM